MIHQQWYSLSGIYRERTVFLQSIAIQTVYVDTTRLTTPPPT